MTEQRPWYKEPETFVAFAALIVSVSAVAVGIYEAALQRKHDRAEVWPHVELEAYTSPGEISVSIENTGIGPAIVRTLAVSVDGTEQGSWPAVVKRLVPADAKVSISTSTTVDAALRPGQKTRLVSLNPSELPAGFLQEVGRVSIRLCYTSVFEEHWLLVSDHIGARPVTTPVPSCPSQKPPADF